jgi:plastocyanin
MRNHSTGHRLALMFASLAAVALLASACGGSSSGSPTTTTSGSGSHASTSTAHVTIQNFKFSPATLTVKPGTKVSVTNKDTATHTLTSNTGKFDTGDIQFNSTGSFTAPSQPGSYGYHCTVHPFMVGTIIVS